MGFSRQAAAPTSSTAVSETKVFTIYWRPRENISAVSTRDSHAETSGITFTNRLTDDSAINIVNYLYYYNGGGVAASDIDGDGLVDLYFTSNLGSNRLYRNLGNFRFEDITDRAGVADSVGWKSGVTMADVNGDGRLDIYVSGVNYLGMHRPHLALYKNRERTV